VRRRRFRNETVASKDTEQGRGRFPRASSTGREHKQGPKGRIHQPTTT